MKRKGFTLIELIVVIALIAILSAVILISYSGAQKRSHDSKRKADLNAIATAAMAYYSSHKSFYGANGSVDITAEPLVSEGFLSEMPIDPLGNNYYLYLLTTAKEGSVYAKMETNDIVGNQCAVSASCLGTPPAGYNYGIRIKP